MGRRNGLMTTLAAIAAVVLLAGCGGGGDDSGSGGSDATTTARGPITYVQGKDNTETVRPMLDTWNADHPDEKVTFKEQSDEADQEHDDLVQHFQAKDVRVRRRQRRRGLDRGVRGQGVAAAAQGQFALDTARHAARHGRQPPPTTAPSTRRR